MNTITRSDFDSIDLRIGTILSVEAFPEMKKPSYKLTIDLWLEIGIKKSSAQITTHYTPEMLVGKQVLCVCNFEPKKMPWGFLSEILTTWIVLQDASVVLISPDQNVENGMRLA